MKSSKKLKVIAKSMFKKSLKNGFVDPQRVRQVLKVATSQKIAGLLTLLKIYKRLIEQTKSKEEIIVETATYLADQKKVEDEALSRTGARKIKFKINPKIVLGVKITHGDWVYDATLDAKLKQLTGNQILK